MPKKSIHWSAAPPNADDDEHLRGLREIFKEEERLLLMTDVGERSERTIVFKRIGFMQVRGSWWIRLWGYGVRVSCGNHRGGWHFRSWCVQKLTPPVCFECGAKTIPEFQIFRCTNCNSSSASA